MGPTQADFSGTAIIAATSRWELRDGDGQLIDSACDHAEREAYRLHKLLDVRVARFSIDPTTSFTLHFESGLALTVFDDSEQYESFSIHLDGQGDLYI